MATNNKFSRGSEWRKWDLHVHTPSSIYQKYGGEAAWDKFIDALEHLPNEVKVIGITDYYFIDGYEKVMTYRANNRLKNIEKIFPILEFRIDTFSSGNENKLQKINLHILFDIDENDLKNEIKKIKNEFINLIPLTRLEQHKTKMLSKENLTEVGGGDLMKGFSNYIPPTDKVFELLNSTTWKEKTFLFLGYKEWSNLEKNNQLKPFKEDLYNKVGAFFSSEYSTFNKSQNWLNEYGNKKLLHSGDIHDFDFLDTAEKNENEEYLPSNNYRCYTWIKADPTFEGLKQIIYEPEERVRIQENNPEYDFDKPTFSKISIRQPIEVFKNEKVKFGKTELPLNKNLVTIIGGRGTGKSLLLNYIANTLKKPIIAYQNKDRDIHFNELEHFTIQWQKNNKSEPDKIIFNAKDKGDLDIIFIEQGKLKNISDYRILADEIKKLLKIESLQFDENLDKEITELLNEIKNLKEWFEYKNEKGEKVNNKEFNESKKKEAENLLKTITTEDNKQKLETYTTNVKTINNCENIILKLNNIKNDLEKFQADINNKIEVLNSDIQKEINDISSIPQIEFESQTDAIETIEKKITSVSKNKKDENSQIKKEFEEQGYKGDLETLLSNAERYQNDIQNAEVKLKEIEEKEKQFNDKIKQRKKLAKKLKDEYERQRKEFENAWNNLLNRFSDEQRNIISKILAKRDISIEGKIDFNKTKFNEKLKEYLDLRTYKNPVDDLEIGSLEDYWDFIKIKLKDFIEGEGGKAETTKKPLDNLFFNLQERKDYLYVVPEIKFMNKTLDQLSVGQRGTLYLLLQLATNAFSSPLIFDQPEDDLDNEFITTELVGLFKELKRYRQIIISTHNANLVVTADAEQVIVANNNDETLSYFSGSLENKDIVEKVCTILEGGKTAFENRRNKYGIK